MKTKNQKIALTLSSSAFYRLIAQGVVVDGRAGGLIVGGEAAVGRIPVVRQHGVEYKLESEGVEQGEFVLYPGLQVPEFRRRTRSRDMLVSSQLLIADAQPHNKILWVRSDQIIVPAETTGLFFDDLAAANLEKNPFLRCDLDSVWAEVAP